MDSQPPPTEATLADALRRVNGNTQAPDTFRDTTPLAPWWHTVLLVVFVLVTSWYTAHSLQSGKALQGSKAARYISTMVMEWLMVAYVWFGLRLKRRSFRDVIGRTWNSIEDALLDLAIAAVYWIVAVSVLAAMRYAMHMLDTSKVNQQLKDLAFITPQNGRELALFLGVALTAGLCEEIIFRGYLQGQFIRWTRNAAAGIILSGLCFGLAHAYQGKTMIVLGVYGAMFGALAYFKRSVIPGIIAHTWQDSISGVLLMLAKHLPIK